MQTTNTTTQIAVLRSGAQYPLLSKKGGWTTLQGPSSTLSVRNGEIAKIVVVDAAKTPDTAAAIAERAPRTKMPIEQRRNGIVPAVYLPRYTKTKMADGSTHLDNGDVVAQQLRGKTLEEVYEVVADKLGCSEKELLARYGHQNPGQQRMCLGNRLRGFYKSLGA